MAITTSAAEILLDILKSSKLAEKNPAQPELLFSKIKLLVAKTPTLVTMKEIKAKRSSPFLILLANFNVYLPIVEFFINLKKGCLNDRDNEGNTPLLISALFGHWEIAEKIIASQPSALKQTITKTYSVLDCATLSLTKEEIPTALKSQVEENRQKFIAAFKKWNEKLNPPVLVPPKPHQTIANPPPLTSVTLTSPQSLFFSSSAVDAMSISPVKTPKKVKGKRTIQSIESDSRSGISPQTDAMSISPIKTPQKSKGKRTNHAIGPTEDSSIKKQKVMTEQQKSADELQSKPISLVSLSDTTSPQQFHSSPFLPSSTEFLARVSVPTPLTCPSDGFRKLIF